MRSEPFKGACKIGDRSSFRKLQRAMRWDRVPSERQFKIQQAQIRAAHRYQKYLNRSERIRRAAAR
jgi:hypothetical protein